MSNGKRADELLGSMTLEEKAGQVFIFTFVSQRQALNDLRHNPGGYVRIFSDAVTVARESRELQSRVRVPLIISADFERGIGLTINGAVDMVTSMCLGAADDADLTRRVACAISEEARAMGVNMNYVPVVDVNVEEENPIINIRAFGGDPALVSRHAVATVLGCREGGVLSCAKHFPGHGDTCTDTHSNLGRLEATRERMDSVELPPFREAIRAGVDSVMSAHLLVPAIEPEELPATLSHRVMTGLLRDELGFQGVAVSDALEMGAIARNFPPEEAIVRAINAGIDQLIMPRDNARAVGSVISAVKDGRIKESRLDEAVGRILAMKERGGLFGDHQVPIDSLPRMLDTAEHRDIGIEAALRGATLIRRPDAVPVPLPSEARVAVISFANSEGDRSYFTEPRTLAAHLESQRPGPVSHVNCGLLDERAVHEFDCIRQAMEAASEADIVVVGAYTRVVINRGTIGLEEKYASFIANLAALGKPMIFVSFGNPYVARQVPAGAAIACAYTSTEVAQQAMAMLLTGQAQFSGKLPITLTLS